MAGAAEALAEARAQWADVKANGARVKSAADLTTGVQNEHLCLTQLCFLETIAALLNEGGGSRGAYVVLDGEGDMWVDSPRGKELQHRSEDESMRSEILETSVIDDGSIDIEAVAVRPMPEDDSWYETTWRQWQDGEIYTD